MNMRRPASTLTVLLGCLLLTSCQHPAAPPPRVDDVPKAAPLPARVLIIQEPGLPDRSAVSSLELLISHFGERCAVLDAERYQPGQVAGYRVVFYLAGEPQPTIRSQFATDLAEYDGTSVWVGPGVADLGEDLRTRLGLEAAAPEAEPLAPEQWTISYGGQTHLEAVSVPAVRGAKQVASSATRAGERRPFAAGGEGLWYVAAPPALETPRFWTACIWADLLHEIMGQPAHEGRRVLAALRDIPVWTTHEQVPKAIRPIIEAGVPVAVLASTWTEAGAAALADRPEAVRGLRTAESLGATVVLVADTGVDPFEHLRLAREVRLHPVAWAGPPTETNPFRLRIAEPDNSPPYCAGGMLPAPIEVSDAGQVDPEDLTRLGMLAVVRDAVALVTFGLWAPPEPFLGFVRSLESSGWRIGDLREVGVQVTDRSMTMASRPTALQLPAQVPFQETVLGSRWQVKLEKSVTNRGTDAARYVLEPPEGSVSLLEPAPPGPAQPFLKGVTLDPWAYSHFGISSKELAETLAERYQRNGLNSVFFYVYNVNLGAAYRTRYRGASVSEWGRKDLLAHLLEACHARGIKVVAWMYSGRDRGSWLDHPEWREREANGREHNPLRLHAAYFLCPRNPEVRQWYAGLIGDLARRYPTLDGIELCEPVVNWFGTAACHCQGCRREFAEDHPGERAGGAVWRKWRAEGLTEFLSGCLQTISEHGVESYIMTITDAWSNGAILTPRQQAAESGFDLDAILDGPYPPDWVNFEIIWQQWAAMPGYGPKVFNYEWAAETAHRVIARTDGRARVLFHVELTDFGSQKMTPARIAETIERVKVAEPQGIECYHSGAMDRKAAWGVLKRVYEGLP